MDPEWDLPRDSRLLQTLLVRGTVPERMLTDITPSNAFWVPKRDGKEDTTFGLSMAAGFEARGPFIFPGRTAWKSGERRSGGHNQASGQQGHRFNSDAIEDPKTRGANLKFFEGGRRAGEVRSGKEGCSC